VHCSPSLTFCLAFSSYYDRVHVLSSSALIPWQSCSFVFECKDLRFPSPAVTTGLQKIFVFMSKLTVASTTTVYMKTMVLRSELFGLTTVLTVSILRKKLLKEVPFPLEERSYRYWNALRVTEVAFVHAYHLRTQNTFQAPLHPLCSCRLGWVFSGFLERSRKTNTKYDSRVTSKRRSH
jgi:hypothetical protein